MTQISSRLFVSLLLFVFSILNEISSAQENKAILLEKVSTCFYQNMSNRNSPRDSSDAKLLSKDPYVELITFFDSIDINQIITMNNCILEHFPNLIESVTTEDYYGAGNKVTSVNGLIQKLMPEFFMHVLYIASAATTDVGWIPHPSQLGVRSIQILHYNPGNKVILHTDNSSIYTMVLMLNSPDDSFVGGDILFRPAGFDDSDLLRSSPEKFGGIIFDSNVLHGVDVIESGERKVLVFEFWAYEDAMIGEKRPVDIDNYKLKVPQLKRTQITMEDDNNNNNNYIEPFGEDEVRSCYFNNYSERKYNRKNHFGLKVRDPLVELFEVIDESDFHNISLLTSCIKQHVSELFEKNNNYIGGKNVTFVGSFLRQLMPELHQHLLDTVSHATEAARWVPHPLSLGVRCVEVLEYAAGNELEYHTDTGSIYTLVVMLGVPGQSFRGGNFLIKQDAFQNDSTIITAIPKRFGGILFDSNKDHGVDTIEEGERLVLVIEFWPFIDSTIEQKRPGPPDEVKGYLVPGITRINNVVTKKIHFLFRPFVAIKNRLLAIICKIGGLSFVK